MTIRLLMTTDTIGDVWPYACELVKALASHDVQVTLATMGTSPTPAQVRAIAALPNVELATSTYALEWMPDAWRDVDAAGAWLLDLAARGDYDLVHLNGYVHAALPFGVPIVVVAHSCVTTWFQAVRGCDLPAEWSEYGRRVRAGLNAADAVVAPTAAILKAVLSAYGIEQRTRVIPNGCDAAAWRPAPKQPFVLAAGTLWDEAKGLADLVAVGSRVTWPIHVAGPISGPCGITAIEPRGVRLLGELLPEALADWMSRASIYALPARYEPFGLSALEAALAGAALVLGDIPSLREVWADAAVYVKPGDVSALARAIESLTVDPLRRRALVAASRMRAVQLSPSRMAASYHELYRELTHLNSSEVCA